MKHRYVSYDNKVFRIPEGEDPISFLIESYHAYGSIVHNHIIDTVTEVTVDDYITYIEEKLIEIGELLVKIKKEVSSLFPNP